MISEISPNLFDTADQTKLYCISSGTQDTPDVEKDLLSAEILASQAKKKFISERLELKHHCFELVQGMVLKTQDSMNKSVKIQTAQNKIISY